METIKSDNLGPELVLKVYNEKIGLEGVVVVDNTVLGPGKGGIRMTHNVNEEEVRRLARAMTLKNALAGIPFGGAKAGIVFDGGSEERKKLLMQEFAKAIKILIPQKYIAGPDVNTGEREMQWFVEATRDCASATGKPQNLCRDFLNIDMPGLPHELGSTGFGVAKATKAAAEAMGLQLKGAKVSIHGFGNVGTFTYKFLTEMGAKVIAIADKDGAVLAENGFDEKETENLIKERKSITEYKKGQKISMQDFWKVPVDILIPASVTDVINDANKNDIQAKLIVEAGNIPMAEATEEELFSRGIMFVPDFVANAGGVISSYAEYMGFSPEKMFELVEEKISESAKSVTARSIAEKKNPRQVAVAIAKEKIDSPKPDDIVIEMPALES